VTTYKKTKKTLLLVLGTELIFETIKNKIPKNWDVLHINTLSKSILESTKVNLILDTSIKETIDLELEIFTDVKVIACASTGSNHIKGLSRKNRPVKIITLRDIPKVLNSLTSASEFSFGLLIALSKYFIPAADSVKHGKWDRTNFPGLILKNKQLGIIGLGRIGKAMARYANCFEMKVGFYDPNIKSFPRQIQRYLDLEKLVSESDFISLHAPYDPYNNLNPILEKQHFTKFKEGSFFINTSRGELIDEAGLISQLKSGRILGAAMDVLVNEPDLINNSLYKYSQESNTNLILTPHIAGYSTENVKIAATSMLQHLVKTYNE
jgi:D-3-phosphoglycerate dehydrogenase